MPKHLRDTSTPKHRRYINLPARLGWIIRNANWKGTTVMKQAQDGANYTRQQKGHSITLHLLFGVFVLWVPTIYFAASPNHFFHA